MRKKQLQITRGQHVDPVKLELARQFRKKPTTDECTLWNALKGNSLGGVHFRRQQVIAGFIVDFYCAAAGLAIELDGPIHAEKVEEDNERDRTLASIGVRTLRIGTRRVQYDLSAVLEEVLAACART